MRKAIMTAVVSLVLVIAPAWFAAPANAGTTTAAATASTASETVTASRPVESLAWKRAGEYSSEWMCLAAGAFGQVRGHWKDWDCYFSDYSGKWVLYVLI